MAGPANRGSTNKIAAIKESVFGTTPATPVGLEVPIVNYQPKDSQTPMKSAQIRTHPFVDRILQGRFMHELGIDWELQPANQDFLLETWFGSAIATKTMKILDALKSVTLESNVGGGSSLFNQYVGFYLGKLSLSCSATDTTPIKITASGVAKTATLDAGATVFTSVTAAANNDPYVFGDATLTVNATATDVVTGNVDFERQVDPLMVWGNRNPREFVPSDVTASGTLTIPYDAGTQGGLVSNWTTCALVMKFASATGSSTFRQFTIPSTKFESLGRQVSNRGVILQEINYEAFYDSASTTICTLTTE